MTFCVVSDTTDTTLFCDNCLLQEIVDMKITNLQTQIKINKSFLRHAFKRAMRSEIFMSNVLVTREMCFQDTKSVRTCYNIFDIGFGKCSCMFLSTPNNFLHFAIFFENLKQT